MKKLLIITVALCLASCSSYRGGSNSNNAYIAPNTVVSVVQDGFKEEVILAVCIIIMAGASFLIPCNQLVVTLAVISFIMGIRVGCFQLLSIVLHQKEIVVKF